MSSEKPRRKKRLRRESTNELLVEEVTSDDMGYDGDVEVLRPDNCEEVESDLEDITPQKRLEWPDPQEELARRLTRLKCDPPSPNSSKLDSMDRGTKRESTAMDYQDARPRPGSRVQPHAIKPELEVSEMLEGQVEQPPHKRRKKRTSQQTMAHRLIRRQGRGTWSDTTDTERTDGTLRELLEGSSSRDGTPEATTTTTGQSVEDDDAMDIG
ncbi:hypothetical protein PV10_00743 [Exophiala mesophila]|uniref:Uncharacterized protein n=1 Tax=Exophiala mesophila TaxID=212818 RepID=A0A0D1X554_EXOME|nr:uncharacterized protein PV10_00743 [Exophiala mesophila]KIV96930.1 hypothetical protein PV10_00743 [Exophiala mesophila]